MKRRRRSMVSNRSWWNWRRLLLRYTSRSLGLQVKCAQNHTWETLEWKNHSLRIQNLMHSLILVLLDLMDT
ncbi:hypothetical protein VIGAN_08280200 [Vigna angularis var. angularis]|uniref:Uncharacterized protein n=1 Tax=Vigna angularis var. angularis TaxID=157739 RepID=A0A0S3ST62_PHAAN|nr:hypothetical protein VIGAN_08280200 [Vigna angularis var. angularis]